MKTLPALAGGAASLAASGLSMAQNSNMMNGDMWYGSWLTGRGGIWIPTLIVIVIVGIVVWFLLQNHE